MQLLARAAYQTQCDMAKVDEANDFANRLLSAIHGIIILSQATGDEHVLKSQINQLKSWIRLM